MEEDEIIQLARELGVEDDEIEKITKPSRRFFNPFFTSILSFLIGFIIGMFFPKVTTISGDSMYPYSKSFPLGPVPGRRRSKIIMVLLGAISLIFGFIISSHYVFGYTRYPPDTDGIGILYGVYSKRIAAESVTRTIFERIFVIFNGG